MRRMNSSRRLPQGRYRRVSDLRTQSQCEYRLHLRSVHGDLPSNASVRGSNSCQELGRFVGGYNTLLRIEWCGCSMLIAGPSNMNCDLNAAYNLVAASWTETENACGEDVRLVADSVGSAEQTSMNQEPNISQGHLCRGLYKFRATAHGFIHSQNCMHLPKHPAGG